MDVHKVVKGAWWLAFFNIIFSPIINAFHILAINNLTTVQYAFAFHVSANVFFFLTLILFFHNINIDTYEWTTYRYCLGLSTVAIVMIFNIGIFISYISNDFSIGIFFSLVTLGSILYYTMTFHLLRRFEISNPVVNRV